MNIYLKITSMLFFIITIAHSLRIYYDCSVSVEDYQISMGTSWAGAAVFFILFIFGIGLSFTAKQTANKIEKKEATVDNLVSVLNEQNEELSVLITHLKKEK